MHSINHPHELRTFCWTLTLQTIRRSRKQKLAKYGIDKFISNRYLFICVFKNLWIQTWCRNFLTGIWTPLISIKNSLHAKHHSIKLEWPLNVKLSSYRMLNIMNYLSLKVGILFSSSSYVFWKEKQKHFKIHMHVMFIYNWEHWSTFPYILSFIFTDLGHDIWISILSPRKISGENMPLSKGILTNLLSVNQLNRR